MGPWLIITLIILGVLVGTVVMLSDFFWQIARGGDAAVLRTANRGTAHLFIANPIRKFQERAESVFASHPPLKDRIARLEALVHSK